MTGAVTDEIGRFIRARLEEDTEIALAMSELGEQLGARAADSAAAVRAKVNEDKEVALALLELGEQRGEDRRTMASIWKKHSDYRPEWAPEGDPHGT